MTEAIKALCEFALKEKGVRNVIAETNLDGFASQRILEKISFKKYKQNELDGGDCRQWKK